MDYPEAMSGAHLIDANMVPAARIAPLDAAHQEAAALASPIVAAVVPQAGGRRGRSRRDRRRRRTAQRGGEQDLSAPTMLLTAAEYRQAGLNPEWIQ
jgi:hypothetical protein